MHFAPETSTSVWCETWDYVYILWSQLVANLRCCVSAKHIRLSATSTTISCVGLGGNTSGCSATPGGRGSSWRASPDGSRGCSLTGGGCGREAGYWEPCEPRGSRTVCAVRRVSTSSVQPGNTRRRCLGYQLTRGRKANGTRACWEQGATAGRRGTAGRVRPGRHGEG